MRIKVSEATPVQIDYLVAKALGCEVVMFRDHFRKIATGTWDEERIVNTVASLGDSYCYIDTAGNAQPIPAYHKDGAQVVTIMERDQSVEIYNWAHKQTDSTPIIAIWRCFVAYKLGEEVDIPDDLM